MINQSIERIINLISNGNAKLNYEEVEFIKSYISSEGDSLSSETFLDLIKATYDYDFMKDCVKNNQLSSDIRYSLILIINDNEFTKECYLESCSKNINLSSIKLFQMINDDKFIFDVLKSKDRSVVFLDKVSIIEKFSQEYVKKCIFDKDIELDEHEKIRLISFLGDEFVKECLLYNKVDLSIKFYNALAYRINDPDLITRIIKGEGYGEKLSLDDKANLVISQGEQYIEECLVNGILPFKYKQLDLLVDNISNVEARNRIFTNENVKLSRSSMYGYFIQNRGDSWIADNISKIPWLITLTNNENVQVVHEEFKHKEIDLPPNMTVGMEIETEGRNSKLILDKFSYLNWKAKKDRSIPDGVEIVSPILHSTEQESRQIYLVLRMLMGMKQKATKNCGAHVHIGADYLKSVQAWRNFCEIWCNTEKIIYAITNKAEMPPRGKIIKYASPITSRLLTWVDSGEINFEDETNLGKLLNSLKDMYRIKLSDEYELEDEAARYDRYFGMNLSNLGNKEKNTIEFRMPNATKNPVLWIDNINLFGGIVAVSQEIDDIQKLAKPTSKQIKKLELFSRLKTDISEIEKFDILMDLIGLEPDRYRRRFEHNIKFFGNGSKLVGKFAKKPIVFKETPVITVEEFSEVSPKNALLQIEAGNMIANEYRKNRIVKQR
ncbi:MAG: hypothetical protein E7314_00160 [Clostridiales bacterium]|nr:hypothetical protein [Clostridiales bacterium]